MLSSALPNLGPKYLRGPGRLIDQQAAGRQRRTGSIFGAQARFPRDAVEFFGTGSEYRRTGDSGGIVRFTFCPNCGATVWYVIEGQEELVAIPVGAFADPEFPMPIYSVYEVRKHAWISLAPQIERME